MFMKLLEKDYIKVNIIDKVTRSGKEVGRQRNKNIVFSISKAYLDLLLKKQIEYNSDSK